MEKNVKILQIYDGNFLRLLSLTIYLAFIIPVMTNAQAGNTNFSGASTLNANKSSMSQGQGKAHVQDLKIKVEKIWDKAPHNAFTDLIRYNGKFYCVFRESIAHVSLTRDADGKIRILVSKDGNKWDSFALIEKEGFDLRDPCLTITPEGKLMVVMGGSVCDKGKLLGRYSQVSFLNNSTLKFSDPIPVKYDADIYSSMDNPNMIWLWRVTWHNKEAFGVIYEQYNKSGGNLLSNKSSLISSRDGINYSLVKSFEIVGKPDETALRFMTNGELFILIRMESPAPNQNGLLGKSTYPFKEWVWVNTGFRLGGPNFIQTPEGALIIATRTLISGEHTALLSTDSIGKFKQLIELPSGGDCSYPGMVIYKNKLYVSYYSSHEGKASIYLAKIPVAEIKRLIGNAASPFK